MQVLFILAYACIADAKNSSLKKTGLPAEGIVFDQHDTGYTKYDRKRLVYIRFVTQKQEWITGTINQGFSIFYNGQYANGEKVKLFYNPANPAEFYVDSLQSELLARIGLTVTGLGLTIGALYQIFTTS